MGTEPRVAVFLDPEKAREVDLFRGVGRYAESRAWRIVMGEKVLSFSRRALKRWEGNGAIGFIRDAQFVLALGRARIPAVNTSKVCVGWGIPSVIYDDAAAGRMAAQFFLERGFRQFAYSYEGRHTIRDKKLEGFAGRLSEAGLSCSIVQQPETLPRNHTWAQCRLALIRQLRQLPKPLAVWTRADRAAARVIEACEAGGIQVPEEIAVLGLGNEKTICPYTHPELASIDVDFETLGFRAAELLDRIMRGDGDVPDLVPLLPERVVERGSADALAELDPHLSEALHYIENHACDPVWVEDVLRHMGVNRRYLERLFERHLHRSPNTEIVRIRIRRARELLSETDMPLPQVAAASGFANYSGLRVAFKRLTGQTPRLYRRNPD
ncbi:substrate-binding domain-containing protein [Candidatus Sumerlaeota bacterium]|nr:substrate-binding domain-containing protein [Candidatus Sumerlaeota bacterium]